MSQTGSYIGIRVCEIHSYKGLEETDNYGSEEREEYERFFHHDLQNNQHCSEESN